MAHPKSPRAKALPEHTGKAAGPRFEQPLDPSRDRPLFSLSKLDFGGPYGWDDIGGDSLRGLVDRLRAFETMTWGEIEQLRSSGAIEIFRLSQDAQARALELKLADADVDELYHLRVTGERRVWGIRDGRVLQLLWWDPKHKVYPGKNPPPPSNYTEPRYPMRDPSVLYTRDGGGRWADDDLTLHFKTRWITGAARLCVRASSPDAFSVSFRPYQNGRTEMVIRPRDVASAGDVLSTSRERDPE